MPQSQAGLSRVKERRSMPPRRSAGVPAHPTGQSVEFSRTLRHTPASVPLGRRLVRAWLRLTPRSYETDIVVLLTSELLDNAVAHTNGDIILEFAEAGPNLRVSVIDEAPHHMPGLVQIDVEKLDDHGRGLRLVSALANRWGAGLLTTVAGARRKV